jgi:hypothetical protein
MTTSKQPGSGKSPEPVPPNIPTPEDPREQQPMHDPPVEPEHDSGEGVARLMNM